jgi:hypothetical protein
VTLHLMPEAIVGVNLTGFQKLHHDLAGG